MKRITSLIWLGLLVAALGIAPLAATGSPEQEPASPESAGTPSGIADLIETGEPLEDVARYAAGFSAYTNGSLTVVQVSRPWQDAGAEEALHYVLYPRDETAPVIEDADLVVGVPIDSIATMSTTFLPHLRALGVMETLAAVDSVSFAYSPAVHDMHEEGRLVEVGSGPNVDIEQLLSLNPDIIMVNSYGGDWDAQPVLEQAGLPVVVSGDWVENVPLGRAEWLLFTSLFYNEVDEARRVFARIEGEYERLVALAATTQNRPTVLSNAPYQGNWAVPGGESYAAQFIGDAGGEYVWSDDESTGALFFDIESVYAEAGDADVWINPGVWTSLEQGAAEDERFTAFKAFENGNVFNNNRRIGAGGGNAYFESGALNPHIILNDLIWALHSDLVPDYEPFYYQKLE